MRKYHNVTAIVLALFLLFSCSTAGFSTALGSPSSNSHGDSSSAVLSLEPSMPQAELAGNIARAKIFRTFLSDNYAELSDAFYEGIYGIGFIDLDRDGGIEMLLFDAGASAAMGLQFFDIIDDKVECISANMESVGAAFGGKHKSDVVVNANSFQDFHLMQDNETGESFFLVYSGNGAADFSYSELIRFGNDDGILSLTSLLHLYKEYDLESGAETRKRFKVNGKNSSAAEYSSTLNKLSSGMSDTGYIAKGVFFSEGDYGSSLDGLMEMTDKALCLIGIQLRS